MCIRDSDYEDSPQLVLSGCFDCYGLPEDWSDFVGCLKEFLEFYHIHDLLLSLIHILACGVPVVCSRIRGNTDLVKNGENGYLVSADQPEEYIQAIEKLLQIWKNTEEVRQMRKNNRARIKQYSLQKIDKIMENIYR